MVHFPVLVDGAFCYLVERKVIVLLLEFWKFGIFGRNSSASGANWPINVFKSSLELSETTKVGLLIKSKNYKAVTTSRNLLF